MPALALLLALRAASLQHTDLALRPCDPQDQQQKWTMPTAHGMGYGAVLTHQSTSLCLMARDCAFAQGTPLVLGDCKAPCLTSQPTAGTFTLHHPGGAHPRALDIVATKGAPPLFATASSDPILGTAVTLQPWDSAPSTQSLYQEWTSALPYTGPDHAMQIGAGGASGPAGKPLCGTGAEACCLSAHSDIVPDGEGGWVLDWLGVAAVVLYLGGGVAMGTARGNNSGSGPLSAHPHASQWVEVAALCKDGVTFVRSKGQRSGFSSVPEARGSVSGTSKDYSSLSSREQEVVSGGSKKSKAGKEKVKKGKSSEKRSGKKDKRSSRESKSSKGDVDGGGHSSGGGGGSGAAPVAPAASAAPAPAAAEAGTASAGGGRWVHITV